MPNYTIYKLFGIQVSKVKPEQSLFLPEKESITDEDTSPQIYSKNGKVHGFSEEEGEYEIAKQSAVEAIVSDTSQDLTNLSVWNFALGEWATVTATDNKSYTTTNVPTPGAGVLHFTQDATGSRTLTINSITIPVIATALATTRVEFTLIGNTITYTTSNGAYLSGLATLQQLSAPVLSVGTPTMNTVPLTWTVVSNESKFQLQYSLNNSVWITLAEPSANAISYLASPLAPGTLHYFRIKSMGDNATFADSVYSNTVSATTTGSAAALLTDDFDDNLVDATKWLRVSKSGFVSETGGKLVLTPTGSIISGDAGNAGFANECYVSQVTFTDMFYALRFELTGTIREQLKIGIYTTGHNNFSTGAIEVVTAHTVSTLLFNSYDESGAVVSDTLASIPNDDGVTRTFKITVDRTGGIGKLFMWDSEWVQQGTDKTVYLTPNRVVFSTGRLSTNNGSFSIDNVVLTNTDFSTLNP